ncbi:MAG: histone deacetylase family protein [Hyphomicrobiaceae bacterium]
MKVVYSDSHRGHDPERFLLRGNFVAGEERPERADRLLAALDRARHTIVEPQKHGNGPRLAVHSLDYLRFLEQASALWQQLPGASREVVGNVHPVRGTGTYPDSIVGRAGWHLQDMACGIGPGTWDAAAGATDVAVTAADLILDGERAAYALCRPPGHHAYRDMAGGHCFLNNTAIAAERLRQQHPRIAIVDIDIHHGNGTQSMFWRRRDVLTVSVHADPHRFYPFFWGHAHERGEGDGEGFNINVPVPLGADDATWTSAVAGTLGAVRDFAPGALLVALGLDASFDDPFGGAKVTAAGFRTAGQAIGRLGLPTLLVQEGGYLSDTLGTNFRAFLDGFAAVG